MKQLLLSPIIIAGMAIMIFFTSCGSKDVPPNPKPTPVDMCPNLPGVQTSAAECPTTPPPAPNGTVTVDKTSINYKETVTFHYSFTNADKGVWIGGMLMIGQSGDYTTGLLPHDSIFTIVAKGTGGDKPLDPITISVGLDPRVTFLTQGTFMYDSIIGKAIDSTHWTNTGSIPPLNNFVHIWQGYTSAPGNSGTALVNGNPGTFKWYFTGEAGFWSHGVMYDQFVITGINTYKVHDFGTILVNGPNGLIPVAGEYWEYFHR